MLYVGQANNTVGKYNATTGAVINANFITGLNYAPTALAVSGNILFVASGSYGTGTVGEYDATTGAVINANFITGLSSSDGLAFSGNNLFVASLGGSYHGGRLRRHHGSRRSTPISSRGWPTPTDSRCQATTFLWRTPTASTWSANTTPPREPPINANFITGLSTPRDLLSRTIPFS